MGDIYCGALVSSDYLAHHGILGMRWGVRRFQRKDGSLTSAGKKQKLKNEHKNEAEKKKGLSDRQKTALKVGTTFVGGGLNALTKSEDLSDRQKKVLRIGTTFANGGLSAVKNGNKGNNNHTAETKKKGLSDKQKRALKVGTAVVVGALAAYGGYKVYTAYKKYSDPSVTEKFAKKKMNKEISKAAKDLHRTKQSYGYQKITENFKNGQINSEKWKERDKEALNKFHEASNKAKQEYENTINVVEDFRSGKIDKLEYADRLLALKKAKKKRR